MFIIDDLILMALAAAPQALGAGATAAGTAATAAGASGLGGLLGSAGTGLTGLGSSIAGAAGGLGSGLGGAMGLGNLGGLLGGAGKAGAMGPSASLAPGFIGPPEVLMPPPSLLSQIGDKAPAMLSGASRGLLGGSQQQQMQTPPSPRAMYDGAMQPIAQPRDLEEEMRRRRLAYLTRRY